MLEVETTAGEEVIRRAKRLKSLVVHPDKVGNLAGASDAFGKVTDVSHLLGSCDKIPIFPLLIHQTFMHILHTESRLSLHMMAKRFLVFTMQRLEDLH